MSKGGIAVLIVAALVFTALGFAFGQVVNAATSSGVLVTEGYVQQYVGLTVAELEQRIYELEERVLQLSGGSTPTPTPAPSQIPEPTNPAQPGNTTPSSPSYSTVKVKSNSVNVRSDASTSASVVSSVTINTVLTYLGQKTDSDGKVWYNVRLSNGTEGWVASWVCYDPE